MLHGVTACLHRDGKLRACLQLQREVKALQKKLGSSLLEVGNTALNTVVILAGLGQHAAARDAGLQVLHSPLSYTIDLHLKSV